MSKTKKILIAFSILLLVFSFFSIARILQQDYDAQQQMKELKTGLKTESDTGEGTVTPSPFSTNTHEPVMLPEFQELYGRNPDIIGWLKIDGTRIDYPIMQNPQDAQYYLNHDFDKKESKNGLPFLDVHSRINDSDILLIHGHHMKSGFMFTDLMKYKNESYYKEHVTLQFSTLYEKEEYEIVAVILSKVYRKSDNVFKYYQIEKVGTSAEFDSYMQNIKQLALYDTGITAQYGDKLIVLSTCEYSTENGRLAVVARKRK
ncbi:class B sortase [Paenibacillus rigui]|uniref:SrtB family sortase n=1 Tax=Paenibacillus rigui TaxID=554312 RepID=A0A229UHX4_9BACL|nr:class B sortase [Paenibacillus rigui]OXM82895.1 SrtB family sortase [Paenibacillus rigui]